MLLRKAIIFAIIGVGLVVCSPQPEKEKRQLDFGGPPPRQSSGRGRGVSNLSAFSPGGPPKSGGQQSFRPPPRDQDDFDDGGPPPFRQPSRGGGGRPPLNLVDEEEEEEKNKKPDRLTTLLQSTKFECGQKKTGYYADDGLECEVFHYCSDGVRHSWLCPEGQVFHQIHLICMPKSTENICTQSEKFHFVNDYLYKPINGGPDKNGTLRYHDRFFPEGYVHGSDHDFDVQGGGGHVPQQRPQQSSGGFRRPQPQHQQFDQDDLAHFSAPAPPHRSPPKFISQSIPQRSKVPISQLDDEDEDDGSDFNAPPPPPPPPRTAPRIPPGIPPSNPGGGGRPRFNPNSGGGLGFGPPPPPPPQHQSSFRPIFGGFGGSASGQRPQFSQFDRTRSGSRASSESGAIDDSRGFVPSFIGFQ